MTLDDLIMNLTQLKELGMGDFTVKSFDPDARAYEPVNGILTDTAERVVNIRTDVDETWRR